ncbi:MAG TPA: trypsin-like peptidase domain-containing protein [Planctomycetaceae bacterium]|nr:trypsin-like peptidase domain-containing protein [Planctomycetaceae bacterium]
MSDGWYVRKGTKTLGPLTETEVRNVLDLGRISAETPVRRGTDGPWTPAGQALADATSQRALVKSESKSRFPVAIAAFVGLAVLVTGLWVVFQGRRELRPAIAAASSEDGIKSSDDATTKPAIESPAEPIIPAPTPVKPRQTLIATRPSEPKSNASVTSVPRDRAPLKTPPVATTKNPSLPNVSHPPQQKMSLAKVAPVTVPKSPVTETDLRALETMARRSSTAKDALALHQVFRATRTIPPALENLFQANLQVWEDRARQDLVRLGDRWVAAAEAARVHDEAAQLFQQAYEMTKNLDLDEAGRTLERASRVDPNAIAADFTLGILNSISPPKSRNPQAAAQHFQVVLQRIPGYVPALNNLALVEVREEKYADAVRHLQEAAARAPACEEVTQNLGRFINEAQLGRLHPDPSVLSEATDFYSQVATTKPGSPAEAKHGWRYMPLVAPKEERAGLSRFQAPEADPTSVAAQGTGVVVAPHYVLTCRHVVDNLALGRADKVELIDPTDTNHQRRLPAIPVEVCQDDDLCLLRCDALEVPPVALAGQMPLRGSEVLLIGFPKGGGFGRGLKTARGIVTALPGDVAQLPGPKWFDFSHQLWSDATSNPGASGGAFCDDHGNVVAIQSTGDRVVEEPSIAKYVGGVPAPNAAAFLRHSLPNFAHPPVGGTSLRWRDVDAKVNPSIVLVLVGYRKVAMVISEKPDPSGLARVTRQGQADVYDDRICTVCNGAVRIRCRAPGCPSNETAKPDAVTNTKSVRRICPACLGTGYVRCPQCSVGIDPLLR